MNIKNERDLRCLYDTLKRSRSANYRDVFQEYLSFLKDAYPTDKYIKKIYNKVKLSSYLHALEKVKNISCVVSEMKKFEKNNQEYFSSMLPSSNLEYYKNTLTFVKQEELIKILLDFAKSLSNDFYLFTNNIINSGKIFTAMDVNNRLSNKYCNVEGGLSLFVSTNFNGYFIYLQHLEDINDLLTLAHEIGHLYYDFINKINVYNYKKAQDNIKEEIFPRTIEFLLIDYLSKYNRTYMINAANSLNNVIIGNDETKNDYIKMKYQFGNFASWIFKDYINKDVSFDNYARYIHDTDYHEILENSRRGYQKTLKK